MCPALRMILWMAEMNWLDIVVIVALAISTFLGLKKGSIKAVLSLEAKLVFKFNKRE